MENYNRNNPLYGSSRSLISLLMILVISFLAFNTVGPFLGILISMPILDFDFNKTMDILANPFDNPFAKILMLITQGVASAFGFIFIPWIYLKGKYNISLEPFFRPFHHNSFNLIGLTMLIVITFMFVNAFFIEWNLNIELPVVLSELEDSMRRFEENAKKLTEQLIQFDNMAQFILALVVIAIIPAIGEELLFRGILQNLLVNVSRNIHIAIWVSAFLFSAIHLQFFGFIPRMLLGALFGYLYFWSGNLLYPMVAHFINNGFTLLMIYLYRSDVINFDVEKTESVSITIVLIFGVITTGLLYYFKKINIIATQ